VNTSKGTDVWVNTSKGTDVWVNTSKGTDVWVNTSKGTDVWVNTSKRTDVCENGEYVISEKVIKCVINSRKYKLFVDTATTGSMNSMLIIF